MSAKGPMDASELIRQLRQGAALGLNRRALMTQAVAVPLTPLEYGDLRDSLVVQEATPDDLRASVGSDLPYAVPQHERLDYRHKVGGPKFLERATLQTESDGEKVIATTVARALGDG